MNELRKHWLLEDGLVYLNHGSFGACPRPVLEAQAALRARMEAEPVRFLTREAPARLARARQVLAAFVGADPDDLAFVRSATVALNSVLRSLPLAPGDEILITDHAYNAVRNIAEVAAGERGGRVAVARVPFPLDGAEQVIEAVVAATGPRTRLAVLDHVTSPTGLVFPIEGLVAALRARDVRVVVDGAHAPGMLPLDLRALDADVYAGNCHKWLCAPKGVGFLHVRRDLQARVRPAVISHGANAPVAEGNPRFRAEFDWMGTDDPTPALALPEALGFVGSLLPGGWPEVMARGRALAREGRHLLAEALGIDLPCPDALLASLATLPLPGAGRPRTIDPLHEALLDAHRIEVPILGCPAHPDRMVRASAALYNDRSDFERLADALRAELIR